jgi:hypothetical protein
MDIATTDFNNFINFINEGDIEHFLYYLQEGFVDPATNENEAIITACRNGNEEMVELLLEYPDVNPSARDNLPIITASQHGHLDVVNILLNDDRVDPRSNNYESLLQASSNGHVDIVKVLLRWYDENSIPFSEFYNMLILKHRRYILLYYDIKNIPEDVYDFNVQFSYDDYVLLKKRYGMKLSPSENKELKQIDSTTEIQVNLDDIEFIDMMLLKFPARTTKRAKILKLLNLPTNLNESMIVQILQENRDDALFEDVSNIIAGYMFED